MKQEILNTAEDLFLNLGFKSTTMDDIANKMGISKKTIYVHFPTKTKLVEATTYFVLDKITAGIEEIRKKDYNAIVELFEIKSFAMQHLKNEKSSPQFQLQKYYPKINHIVQKHHLDQMECCITENLTKGIDGGLYRPDLPLQFVSKIYFVGISGVKDPDFFPPDKFALHELYGSFLEYHLRAIVTEKGMETLKEFIKIQNKND